jgi:hypothetical protein
VESEDAFCRDTVSSSLTAVEVDEAPRSGDDAPEIVFGSCLLTCFDGVGATLECPSRELVCFAVRASSASASSAQLGAVVKDGTELAAGTSFPGVVEPDAALLCAGVEVLDRPFAACAYEKVAMLVRGSAFAQNQGVGERRWTSRFIPSGSTPQLASIGRGIGRVRRGSASTSPHLAT